jgi:hypothetical protein
MWQVISKLMTAWPLENNERSYLLYHFIKLSLSVVFVSLPVILKI